MSQTDAEKWNERYAVPEVKPPLPFLVAHVPVLGTGSALVLAAGVGQNAVYLAEQGFSTTALDVSEVGLSHCRNLAKLHGVQVDTLCADLEDFVFQKSEYDLITMIYFYEPRLLPSIRKALKPGGHFLFQTFSKQHAEVGTFGPKSPAYLSDVETVTQPFSGDNTLTCDETIIEEDGDTEAVIQMIIQKV